MSTMINKRRFISLLFVMFSNGMTLFASILAGFIIPKVMSYDDYGLYKIFNLYINYLPLFHFGLSTGIYLTYGNKSYNELNKSHFRYYFRILIISQSIFAAIISIIASALNNQDYKYILFALAVILIMSNITNYFQLISQTTERYKEFSIRNLIQSILNCSVIVTFYILWKLNIYVLDYQLYMWIVVGIYGILALWYVVTYRDMIFGKIESKPTKTELFSIYRVGFILIISGMVAQSILNIDRQFVSILYSYEEYAIYAFAYSLLGSITTFIGAISTVIYPSLKRQNLDEMKCNYSTSISIIAIVSSISLALYFVIVFIVKNYIEKYNDSLQYLMIIMPTVILSTEINVIVHNYYKAMNKELTFFVLSILVLLVSVVANFIAYYCFNTMISISIASVICMALWYLISQVCLYANFKFKFIRNNIYILLSMACFYLVTQLISNIYIGISIYSVVVIFISIIMYHELIISIIRSMNNFKKKKVVQATEDILSQKESEIEINDNIIEEDKNQIID